MAEVDMQATWRHVDPILWSGDGTALFAIEARKAAGGDYAAAQVAVAFYRRSITTWRKSDVYEWPQPTTADAAAYRRAHPGCSFAEVVAYVQALGRDDGGGL